MPCEISDEEFEAYLEKVYEAWEEGGCDTVDIANRYGISEAKVDWILACYLEGKNLQMEEARFELENWSGFDPNEIVESRLSHCQS